MNRENFPQLVYDKLGKVDWIELGVCRGDFSEYLLSTKLCKSLYSVDIWSGERGHDDTQYQKVLEKLNKYDNSIILRKTFEDALNDIPNGSLGFIFLDGYASDPHRKATIEQWWSKLTVGGLFAVHDYHDNWPCNIEAIDSFCQDKNISRLLTEEECYPSAYFWKD